MSNLIKTKIYRQGKWYTVCTINRTHSTNTVTDHDSFKYETMIISESDGSEYYGNIYLSFDEAKLGHEKTCNYWGLDTNESC